MGAYATKDIRNLALIGHSGSGKTTLIERLLAQAGSIPQAGTIARGDTVCDFDAQEQAAQHSIETSLAFLDADGCHVNMIDTPGTPDFIGRSMSVLPAVETAMLVVNAKAGIQPMTSRLMDAAVERNLCRIIVVNHIDAEEADCEAILQQLQAQFGSECLPINLPAQGGKSVIDCYFQPGGDATDFSSVETAHDQLIDQVVEVDDELMSLYLEQGQSLQPEQLHAPFEQALREGHLIPVCFTSATTGAGIDALLNVFTQLMPNPTEGNPPVFLKGEGEGAEPVSVVPDADAHVVAHVFKVVNDPFRGRLGLFRIHQGTMTHDSALFVGDARKSFKVNHLFRLQGKEQIEVKRGVPGDICAVARVDELFFDAVLHDSHDEDHYHLRSTQFPMPLYGLALKASKRGDEQKLADALQKLSVEDPSIDVEHNATLNETVLRGLGDVHLKTLMQRLIETYHVDVSSHPPSIAYKETISQRAEGHYRHKKQTGGAGQFGEVKLFVEPLAAGEGFRFVNKVVGGSIPGQFIPAVEKGVRQAMAEGVLAGFPMQDLSVTVYDGKHHAVDSKEIAFVTAGKKAFQQATEAAKPVVLEPVASVAVSAAQQAMGDLSSDFSTRRAHITGSDIAADGRLLLHAEVPLAEIEGYESQLNAMTGGEGTYTLSFSHYQKVPAHVQKTLVDAK